MTNRRIAAIITAITGDRVVIGHPELNHVIEQHFPNVPSDVVLELIERILKDPTEIYEEKKKHWYHLFYRVDNQKYLVAVIKKAKAGNYLATLYPTGNRIRNKHKKLKRKNSYG